MDETILASGGAYNGRDDFIREAITDRIAEDRLRPSAGGPAPVILLRSKAITNQGSGAESDDTRKRQSSLASLLSAWSGDDVPTLPPHAAGGVLYGLHNRDYPTLWAAHSLISMTLSSGGPIPWSEFLTGVLDAAWKIGSQLAKVDQERPPDEMKASVGFPINAEKRQSSETRFIEHMLGILGREGGPTGPLFAMQLVGATSQNTGYLVAPTEKGKGLLEAFATVGLAARPPHSSQAWQVFREHLREALPADYEAWAAILNELVSVPAREDLVRRFAERWPGAAAATNVAGYVSRAREWGLVEPKLANGRYVLTELGRYEVEESRV